MRKKVEKIEKELQLNFIKIVQEKHQTYTKEQRAREYCEKVIRRKEQKFEKIREIVTTSAFIITAFLLLFLLFSISNIKSSSTKIRDNSKTYTMQGELQGNHVVLSDGNMHEVDKANANYTSEPMQVTVTLNDNGTEDMLDDVIIDIQ